MVNPLTLSRAQYGCRAIPTVLAIVHRETGASDRREHSATKRVIPGSGRRHSGRDPRQYRLMPDTLRSVTPKATAQAIPPRSMSGRTAQTATLCQGRRADTNTRPGCRRSTSPSTKAAMPAHGKRISSHDVPRTAGLPRPVAHGDISHGNAHAHRCAPPGRPGWQCSRATGLKNSISNLPTQADQGQYRPCQGNPRRTFAAGGLRRLRRQPSRFPRLQRNPPRLLPDSARKTAKPCSRRKPKPPRKKRVCATRKKTAARCPATNTMRTTKAAKRWPKTSPKTASRKSTRPTRTMSPRSRKAQFARRRR